MTDEKLNNLVHCPNCDSTDIITAEADYVDDGMNFICHLCRKCKHWW